MKTAKTAKIDSTSGWFRVVLTETPDCIEVEIFQKSRGEHAFYRRIYSNQDDLEPLVMPFHLACDRFTKLIEELTPQHADNSTPDSRRHKVLEVSKIESSAIDRILANRDVPEALKYTKRRRR